MAQLWIATRLLVVMTVLTGGVYPLFVTGVAQTLFPHEANGSLMERTVESNSSSPVTGLNRYDWSRHTEGRKVSFAGSELIGQPFSQPEYFWGRLSATSPMPYNAAASSGSNYGPLHPALKAAAETRLQSLQHDQTGEHRVPVDLVTASGSGLDPHISPEAAEVQIARVAKARHLQEFVVRDLVQRETQGRQFGLLGESRVNVLLLNLALDRLRNER